SSSRSTRGTSSTRPRRRGHGLRQRRAHASFGPSSRECLLLVDGGPRPASTGRMSWRPTMTSRTVPPSGLRPRTGRPPPRDPRVQMGLEDVWPVFRSSGEIACILTIPFTFRRRWKTGRGAALVSDPSRRLYPAPMPLEFGVFQGASVGPRPWDVTEPLRIRRDIEVGVAADAAGFDTYWAPEHHCLEEYSHGSSSHLACLAARWA